jgi:uncharacterized membrane protein
MRMIYCFAMVFLFACSPGGPVEVDGIRVEAGLRSYCKNTQFDYTGNLDKALKGDDAALGALLNFNAAQDSAANAGHSLVMKSLLERMGDELFSQKIEKLDTEAKQRIWAGLQLAGAQSMKNESPLTLKALMPPVKVEVHAGLYAFGTKNSSFRDCAEPDQRYLMVDETGGSLEQKYRQLLKYPYPNQPVVADLKGYTAPYYGELTLPNGFAGFFVATEIIKMETKNFRNTCIPYDFWAVGTEPFWYAQVSAAEGVIEYRGMEDETTKVFAYQSPVEADSTKIYTGVNQDSGDNIRIELGSKPCSDGMSDRQYSLEVKLTMNGKELSGCGIPYESGRDTTGAEGN